MAAASALLDYLIDQLAPLGDVRGRRMFSGHGLYLNGAIVGIIVDETLYLKVDAGNRAAFEAESMAPFTYASKGRRVALSYWEAPAAVIEEPDQLQQWVKEAASAARRVVAAKSPRAAKTRRRPSP
jgi:DNA transformation protein and related proteins